MPPSAINSGPEKDPAARAIRPLAHALLWAMLFAVVAGCGLKEKKPKPVPPPPMETGPKKAADVYEKYPGLWAAGPTETVDAILAEEKVAVCAPYDYKRHPEGNSYLVRCKNSSYYIVWTGMRKASGPYQMRKSSRAAVKAREEAMQKNATPKFDNIFLLPRGTQ
jgi:hypothetical protein